MKYIFLFFLICLIGVSTHAQEPVLLKDFRTNGASSFEYDPYIEGITTDNMLYFIARTPEFGEELYRTTGTELGTQLIKDIFPGDSDPNIVFLGKSGNTVLFAANDGEHGYELWTSEGTTSSTKMVEDIREGTGGGISVSFRRYAFFEGDFYFAGSSGGLSDLYKYELEEKNISLVKDINPNGSSNLGQWSDPRLFTPAEGTMYFTAYTQDFGNELWRTDGTSGGTNMIADITEGTASTQFFQMKAFGGTLVFLADDGESGRELWISLGSNNFTYLIKDLTPGEESSDINIWEVVDGNLYFSLKEGFSRFLWRTDGTEDGTEKVLDEEGNAIRVNDIYTLHQEQLFFRGNNSLSKVDSTGEKVERISNFSLRSRIVTLNDSLYFVGTLNGGNGIYKTDGTKEGITPVKQITSATYRDISNLTTTETHLYFLAETDSFGMELFVSDGSSEGTFLLIDSTPGPEDSYDSFEDYIFHALGDKLIFPGFDEIHGRELWITDGTKESTRLLSDLNPQTEGVRLYSKPVSFKEETFFTTDEGLWKTDGSSSGTQLILGEEPIFGLNTLGDKMLFTRSAEGLFRTLWTSDGTIENTLPLLDSATAAPLRFSLTQNLPKLGNNMFFSGRDAETGYELWITDGTAEGTRLLKDIHPTEDGFNGFFEGRYIVWKDELYFTAFDPEIGFELWKTDGTEDGTRAVADINPFGNSFVGELTIVDDELFFTANDGTGGNELWKTDGTSNGTVLVKDIFPGDEDDSGARFSKLVAFNDRLYFSAEDGVNGRELWTSDGTEAGTLMLRDISPGTTFNRNSDPRDFFATDSVLYFSARDSSGRKIWKTNGTVEGTRPFLDLEPSLGFVDANGTLFFSGSDGNIGRELWRTDGTEEGTYLVADIFEGQADSYPSIIGYQNNVLYFEATDAANGRELRALSPLQIKAEIIPNLEQLCSLEEDIAFAAQVEEAGENPSFQWFVNEFPIANENGEQFLTSGLEDGDEISLRVIADQSAWTLNDTVFAQSIPIVAEIIDAAITVSENQLTATEADSYEWYLDGLLLPDTTQTIIAEVEGIYQVEVFSENGCSFFSEAVSIQLVTSIDPRLKMDIQLYPNPVSASLIIESNLNEEIALTLISATGQRLQESQLLAHQKSARISMEKYAPGVYILQMRTLEGIYFHKLIKK